jgi:hypothetical protein
MIEMADIQPTDWVLDPSKGDGVFYNNLPSCRKAYCEITEGKDFYEWKTPVDVVIGNPPFSHWTKWLDHTLSICKDRFVYVFGCYSLTHSRIQAIHDAGFGITKLHVVKVAWWLAQSIVVVAEKGKPSILSSSPAIKCPECGVMCGRGVRGNPPNECARRKN